MITQLHVIGNQERKHTGLVMKTSYTKKGLKTQPPGTNCHLGWQRKQLGMKMHKFTGLWHRKIPISISKAEASSADVKKEVSKLPCNTETLIKLH